MNPNSEIFHTCPQGKKYITTKSMYTMETLFISGWREDEERQTEKRTEGKIKQEKRATHTEKMTGESNRLRGISMFVKLLRSKSLFWTKRNKTLKMFNL